MCTYLTDTLAVSGSAKGTEGWSPLSQAVVYFDHPVHAPHEHTLNIDLTAPEGGARRVAVELSARSARALAETILAMLESPEVRQLER
ncbi:MAG TPA: DUF6295 family protein [Actinomycetota bacterium]|nr:DUF6295 family protein [Actinomycetota bacterium]